MTCEIACVRSSGFKEGLEVVGDSGDLLGGESEGGRAFEVLVKEVKSQDGKGAAGFRHDRYRCAGMLLSPCSHRIA